MHNLQLQKCTLTELTPGCCDPNLVFHLLLCLITVVWNLNTLRRLVTWWLSCWSLDLVLVQPSPLPLQLIYSFCLVVETALWWCGLSIVWRVWFVLPLPPGIDVLRVVLAVDVQEGWSSQWGRRVWHKPLVAKCVLVGFTEQFSNRYMLHVFGKFYCKC